MTTLETAERIVSQLNTAELKQFRDWFAEYDGKFWDEQIEADAGAGKFDAMAAEAMAEYNGATD